MSMEGCHIVIGGGCGGIMVVRQLLEAGEDVVLVESGGPNEHVDAYNSASCWAYKVYSTTRNYFTCEQTGLLNRVIKYPQGKGIGGNANINAMIFSGGSKYIYDNFWGPEWNSDELQRLMIKVQQILELSVTEAYGKARDVLSTNNKSSMDPSLLLFDDDNYRDKYLTSFNKSTGIRHNMSQILNINQKNSKKIGKLSIIYNSTCKSVHLNSASNRATAVTITNNLTREDTLLNTGAASEVVISAGTIETPRILYNSNLLAEEQQGHGYTSTLQDHVVLPVIFLTPFSWSNGSNEVHNSVHGWINLDERGKPTPSGQAPYIQLLFVDGKIAPDQIPELVLPRLNWYFYASFIRPLLFTLLQLLTKLWLVRWLCQYVCGFLICLVNPYSVGFITIDSNKTILNPNYLQDKRDLAMLYAGYQAVLGITRRSLPTAVMLLPGRLTHSLTHSLTCLLTHSPTHSLTYSLTYSLTHSLTYSPTYLLTYSLTRSHLHSLHELLMLFLLHQVIRINLLPFMRFLSYE